MPSREKRRVAIATRRAVDRRRRAVGRGRRGRAPERVRERHRCRIVGRSLPPLGQEHACARVCAQIRGDLFCRDLANATIFFTTKPTARAEVIADGAGHARSERREGAARAVPRAATHARSATRGLVPPHHAVRPRTPRDDPSARASASSARFLGRAILFLGAADAARPVRNRPSVPDTASSRKHTHEPTHER